MLREHRERLELMAQASEIDFWFCDLPFDKLVWDNRVKETSGIHRMPKSTSTCFTSACTRKTGNGRGRPPSGALRTVSTTILTTAQWQTMGASSGFAPSALPFLTNRGGRLAFDGVTIDVTAKRQAEETTALLAAIVASSDDAIVSKNLNGVITSWNKGAERLFGYTPQEAIGQHITLIIPRNRLNEEDEILSRIRRGERVDHFETVRVRKDGTTIELSLTISPVLDRDGG
jgi:PAS domain S-box-containing protein